MSIHHVNFSILYGFHQIAVILLVKTPLRLFHSDQVLPSQVLCHNPSSIPFAKTSSWFGLYEDTVGALVNTPPRLSQSDHLP
jgi:hypothetical protein